MTGMIVSLPTDTASPPLTNGLVLYQPQEDPRVSEARSRLSVARSRARLSISELRTEVKAELVHLTDWREWFRAHPERYLLLAFTAGFLFARRR